MKIQDALVEASKKPNSYVRREQWETFSSLGYNFVTHYGAKLTTEDLLAEDWIATQDVGPNG